MSQLYLHETDVSLLQAERAYLEVELYLKIWLNDANIFSDVCSGDRFFWTLSSFSLNYSQLLIWNELYLNSCFAF
ncbi:MAG: hypothetical protein N4J56_005150 [Chroococcidiopsis sp. SAG 2025]|nr:hypothetical protein [Chroococcidiopsis sp. SAG 2025]